MRKARVVTPAAALVAALIGGTAAANPSEASAELTAGAGEEQVGTAAAGTLGGDARATYREWDREFVETAEATSSAELRTDRDGLAGSARVAGAFTTAFAGVPDRPALGAYASAEAGTRPGLDARRDVGRSAYAGAGAGFQLGVLAGRRGDRVRGVFATNIAGTLQAQGDAARATYVFDLDGYYSCTLRPDARARCLHVLDTYATGVSGGTQAVVATIYAARWTGVDLGSAWGDLGVGLITDDASLSIEQDGKVVGTVKTEDLPRISALAWNAGLATLLGPIELEVRTQRSGYVSLDGDMSIEDRASVTAALPLDATTKLSASGFAAHTTWWTSARDPGSHANTGGGELALDLAVHDFAIHAGAGVARSFYAVLDGGVADRPALGFRSAIDVRHSIKNWTP